MPFFQYQNSQCAMTQLFKIRKDIEYLASSWIAPKLTSVNGNVNKDKSFDELPALISVIRKEKVEPVNTQQKERRLYRVNLLLLFSKLSKDVTTEEYGEAFDAAVDQNSEILESLWRGMTEEYLSGNVRNWLVATRGYSQEGDLTFTNQTLEWGSARYLAVECSFVLGAPSFGCLDCGKFVPGAFDKPNFLPPTSIQTSATITGSSNGQIFASLQRVFGRVVGFKNGTITRSVGPLDDFTDNNALLVGPDGVFDNASPGVYKIRVKKANGGFLFSNEFTIS